MSNSKTRIDINHIAKLASLEITDKEKQKFQGQLTSTLKYFSKLSEVATGNIKPFSHAAGIENINRKDIPQPSLSQDKALSNTKQKQDGFFKVKGIFEEE